MAIPSWRVVIPLSEVGDTSSTSAATICHCRLTCEVSVIPSEEVYIGASSADGQGDIESQKSADGYAHISFVDWDRHVAL